MKWIGKRTSFIDQKNKCTIVIYPDNVFWEKGLMSAWFCMWLVIGATMTWSFSLNLTRQETLIVVIFLAFWAYYATKVGRSLFWLLWGKELIKIDKSGLTLKKSIKGFGKSNTYFLENIQKNLQGTSLQHRLTNKERVLKGSLGGQICDIKAFLWYYLHEHPQIEGPSA